MKYSRIIMSVLFFAVTGTMEAKWPDDLLLSEENSNNVLSFNKRTRIFAKKEILNSTTTHYFSNGITKVDTDFITGAIKKEESEFTRILHWDFKVKFQLTRNMNIIFSYN